MLCSIFVSADVSVSGLLLMLVLFLFVLNLWLREIVSCMRVVVMGVRIMIRILVMGFSGLSW